MVGGPCCSPALLPRGIATVASTPVQPVARASASSGAYRRVPQVVGAIQRVSNPPVLLLVPAQCEYLFSARSPSSAAILSWGIYTNTRAPADLI